VSKSAAFCIASTPTAWSPSTPARAADDKRLFTLRRAITIVIGNVTSDEIAVAVAIEAIKDPTITRDQEKAVPTALRARLYIELAETPDLWPLVELAQNDFPGLNLSTRSYFAARATIFMAERMAE
jgi:hypothetical protein